jgi:nucleotide-binding universal stress UspA family protein
MYKKILVPLDGSALAEKALYHAERLAKTFDAEIILLQVVPLMPIYADPELTPFIVDEIKKETAKRYLTKLAEELKNRGLKSRGQMMTRLQVAPEIIDFAKGNRVDLIVMCTHGHSGIIRGVLGSVTHKVLTRAEIPVLLISLKR